MLRGLGYNEFMSLVCGFAAPDRARGDSYFLTKLFVDAIRKYGLVWTLRASVYYDWPPSIWLRKLVENAFVEYVKWEALDPGGVEMFMQRVAGALDVILAHGVPPDDAVRLNALYYMARHMREMVRAMIYLNMCEEDCDRLIWRLDRHMEAFSKCLMSFIKNDRVRTGCYG